MNYFLFLVTRDAIDQKEILGVTEEVQHRRGDCGVGRTTIPVSMAEYPTQNPFGMMYVAPSSYVEDEAAQRKLSPYALSPTQLKDIILSYWK